jgi:hypothetical protein
MKLELKHWAAYLPFDVKVQSTITGTIFTLKGLNDRKNLTSWGDWCYASFDSAKLILHPLSDLTKEIEIKGKKFIPIDVLSEEFLCPFYKFGQHTTGWVGFIDTAFGSTKNNMPIYMDNEIMGECHYFIYQKLVEWHFDIDNLIGHNLAIDINTLK